MDEVTVARMDQGALNLARRKEVRRLQKSCQVRDLEHQLELQQGDRDAQKTIG